MGDYSEKEKNLIESFGFGYLLEEYSVPPPVLYRMMVEKAFLNNLQGTAVESLRRCYQALLSCSVYRNTQEWDDLIQIEEDFHRTLKFEVKK